MDGPQVEFIGKKLDQIISLLLSLVEIEDARDKRAENKREGGKR